MGEKSRKDHRPTEAELAAMRADGFVEPGRTVQEELAAADERVQHLMSAAGGLVLRRRGNQ